MSTSATHNCEAIDLSGTRRQAYTIPMTPKDTLQRNQKYPHLFGFLKFLCHSLQAIKCLETPSEPHKVSTFRNPTRTSHNSQPGQGQGLHQPIRVHLAVV